MENNRNKQVNGTPADFFAGANAADDIASRLKSFYASVEAEPIPDHLLSLLEKLDEAERKHNADGQR